MSRSSPSAHFGAGQWSRRRRGAGERGDRRALEPRRRPRLGRRAGDAGRRSRGRFCCSGVAPGQIPTTTACPIGAWRRWRISMASCATSRSEPQRTATDLGGDFGACRRHRRRPGRRSTPWPVACWRLDTQLAQTAAVPDADSRGHRRRKRDGSQHGSARRRRPSDAGGAALLDGCAFYNEWRCSPPASTIGPSLLHVAVTANLYQRRRHCSGTGSGNGRQQPLPRSATASGEGCFRADHSFDLQGA